jgi:hypothetical protein
MYVVMEKQKEIMVKTFKSIKIMGGERGAGEFCVGL